MLTVLCQCGLGHAADTRPGSAPQPAQPRSSRPGPASPAHSKSKTRSRTSLRPAGPPARRLAQPTAAAVAAHRSDLGPVEKGYEGDGLLLPGLGPPGRVVKPGRGSRPGLAGGGDGPVLVRLGGTASAHGEERGRRALPISLSIYLSIYLSISLPACVGSPAPSVAFCGIVGSPGPRPPGAPSRVSGRGALPQGRARFYGFRGRMRACGLDVRRLAKRAGEGRERRERGRGGKGERGGREGGRGRGRGRGRERGRGR